MAEDITNETQDTSEDDGKNTESAEGTQSQSVQPEKTLTQSEVNEIIKRKQAEWSTKYKKDYEKQLEGKHVLTADDVEKLKTEAIESYKLIAAIDNKRAEYKAKGLTDAQLDAIAVDKAEDFDKKAQELFGTLLKKQAPALNPGVQQESISENEELNKRLRETLTRRTRF